ncbi:pyridoxal-phosphate-dependent aminotransferase family protein [Roseovarius rhodophyticola]|uniref:Aminotransferase class V-fold PLP-dependent enzyme n=1 Tax=Roseovarius rhodophyticola TaxID=3080827 RepID=A0ABZ2TH93_9RHOB|nr:aminotransferase class V-fold PLP-dependent enzyme [Roseovarius sp. W115]MDV2929283.1 aminotransferase class V-fold PLP-dependent enzyme [Roseovarius sp. W115]
MSGAGGRHYLAIPGPSIMPDRVLQAMHRPAPDIYSGALVDSIPPLVDDLRAVARTKGEAAIYIGNGHAGWEAAMANTLQPGDKVLFLATGRFAYSWSEMAEGLGVAFDVLDFGRQTPVDPNQVEAALRADKSRDIKAVMVCHVDTSTSVRNDIPAIRAAMDAADHPALLFADCIASLACDRFEMDAWGVDVTMAASQKGLMTPPGLAFVFFSEKAAQARTRIDRVSRYWDWVPRARPEMFYQYFMGTTPTHHVFGLRAALDMIAEEGLEAIWARHERLARAIWAACDIWAQDGPLRLNIANRDHRSRAVTSLSLDGQNGTRLRQWLESEMGLTLGIGLGMETPDDPGSDRAFRIGHMGHVNGQAVLGVLGAMEAGLKSLGIPHGVGAIDAAARELAKGSMAMPGAKAAE